MLVLSRKSGESIIIAGDVIVQVLGIDSSGTVRLGIQAPREVRIMRSELLEDVKETNADAARSTHRAALPADAARGTPISAADLALGRRPRRVAPKQ